MKKIIYILTAIAILLISLSAYHFLIKAHQKNIFLNKKMNHLSQKLSNSNFNIRKEAINEFVNHSHHKNFSKYLVKSETGVLPVLINAAKSPYPDVRLFGIGWLEGIAYFTQPALRNIPTSSGIVNLQDYPSVKKILEKEMLNPSIDRIRRGQVLATYSLAFPLSAKLQQYWINQFSSTKDHSFQDGIVESLTLSNPYAPETAKFLTHLFDDPKWQPYLLQYWRNTSDYPKLPPPPAAILPKLAKLILTDKNKEERGELVDIFGKYGAEAKPYLPELEQLLKKEPDSNVQYFLKITIKAIRENRSTNPSDFLPKNSH